MIIVTGATGGIGAATVEGLQARGEEVRGVDLRDGFDVTDPVAWTSLAAEHGRVEGLVNAAGVTHRARVGDVDLEGWNRTLAVNVTGPMLGIQAVLPRMASGGSIVNVCSLAALTGHYTAAYTASKWALRGLSRTASLELGPRGIRVNAVFPGYIDTPMTASAPPAFRGARERAAALGRAGGPEEVDAVIGSLLSGGSRYVTGAEVAVYGPFFGHGAAKGL